MKLTRDEVFYGTGPIVMVPREEIRLAPTDSVFGTKIQQLQTNQQPLNAVQTPINVQRLKFPGSTQSYYAIQFFQPLNNPNYTATTAFIVGANGTSSLQAISGKGPLKFSAPNTSTPGAIGLQTNTVNGNTSTTFGDGNSRSIVRT